MQPARAGSTYPDKVPVPHGDVPSYKSACFDKGGELFELLAADSSLHIRHLQVIPKVAVHIFVVIALRKLTKLTIKTMTAEVIMTGRANAVAAPIAIRKNQTVEQRIVCIHATTLAHGHVVRRIEAAGADIAPSAGITGLSIDGIGCTQGIAVILYQPEVVLLTEQTPAKSKGFPNV